MMWENQLSYREVIPHQFAARRWKDIVINVGGTQSTLQDIKLPECAGGYAYKDSNKAGSVVRNRFIYWKISYDVLELVEQSLDYNLSGNHIRFKFQSAPILEGISIYETNTEVIVLVITVSSVHRLIFTHPTVLQRHELLHLQSVDEVWPSIFSDVSVIAVHDSSNFHVFSPTDFGTSVPHTAASFLSKSGEAIFAVASGLGHALVIRMPSQSLQSIITTHELRQSSVIHRLWSGIVPSMIRGSQDIGDTAMSLCLHALENDEIFVFTLCRDHKLRMWTCREYECMLAVDVVELVSDSPMTSSSKQHGSQSHSLRKALGINNSTLYLGAFLCFADRRQICVFNPVYVLGHYQLLLIATIHCPDYRLIDFSLTLTHVWSLWVNADSERVLKYTTIDDENSTNLGWTDIILESSSEKDFRLTDFFMEPREAYMRQIFMPGNFSVQSITKAINIYRRSVTATIVGEINVPVTVLQGEVSSVVENEIQNQASEYELSEDEYLQLQLENWSRFYSCCVQYQEVESKTMGIMLDDRTGMVCLIKKAGFSLLRPQDNIEFLLMKSHLSHSVNWACLATLCDESALWRDLVALSKCLNLIDSQLREEVKEAFNQDLYHQQSPETVALALVNSLLTGVDDSTPSLQQQIVNLVVTIPHLIPCVEVILGAVDLAHGQPANLAFEEDTLIEASQQISCNRLFASHIGASIVAEAVYQKAKIRLDLCRNLLMLLLFLLRIGERACINAQVAQKIRKELIPQTSTLTQAYHVLCWISTTVVSDLSHNTIESSLCQLAMLNITETSSSSVAMMKYQKLFSQPMTLVEAFVHLDGGMQARSLLAHNHFLDEEFSATWTEALTPLIQIVSQLLWPVSMHFAFPEFLLTHSQHIQLIEYVRLLQNWCDWNSSSRKFILGHVHLNLGEADKAVEWFMQAADGITRDEFLYNKILQVTEETRTPLNTIYFLKVIRLMEQFNYSDQIITIANFAIGIAEKNDPNLSTLWSIIFKYHLELNHNEEAYAALKSNTDVAQKKDCLRQFVVTLCERHQYKSLVEFPYIDLHDELISILEARARSVDLTTHNYYDILYSFHIFRSNYRKAGSIMYEYGMRLGIEVPGLRGLQKQAKCYLTALNCLRLLKPTYAWIVKPIPNTVTSNEELEASGSSPKRSYEDEEVNIRSSKCKLEVLEFESIKKEYDLLHARLHLYKKNHDPSSITGPLTPDETFGLLINSGLYDSAIDIALIFFIPMHPVFEGLASRCVKLTQLSYNKDENADILAGAWEWLAENDLSDVHAIETSVSDHAWALLKTYLNRYEKPGQTKYLLPTASKLLSLGSHLPPWLVRSYKLANVSELIALYVDYFLLEDATALVIEYIDAIIGKGKEYFGLKDGLYPNAPPIWMPYTVIDNLLYVLDDNYTDESCAKLHDRLTAKLDDFNTSLIAVSADMIKLRQQ